MPAALPDDAWVEKNYERVRRAAWLLTGDVWETDDLAQETFVRALTRWGQFRGRSQDFTWLYTIMLNLHRSRLRALARTRERLRRWFQQHVAEATEGEGPAELLAAQAWKRSVWARVSQLPSIQQHAIVLRFGEELEYEQIAEIQRCAVATARTRVHYGLKKLQIKFAAEDWAEADLGLPLLRTARTARTSP